IDDRVPDGRVTEQAQQAYDEFFDEQLVRVIDSADGGGPSERQSSDSVLQEWQATERLRKTHLGIAPETTYFLGLGDRSKRMRLRVTLDARGEVADAMLQFRGPDMPWIDVPRQNRSLLKRYAGIVGFHSWLP